MKRELQKQLFDNYPDLFIEKDLPPDQSNMCFGFECDDGWYDLINTLCHLIKHYDKQQTNKPDYKPVVVQQVKEKFGGLRFYYYGGDDIIAGMVSFAEAMSQQICEKCGSKGKTNTKRWWVKTLCEEHDVDN
jgi:hypothetical protein